MKLKNILYSVFFQLGRLLVVFKPIFLIYKMSVSIYYRIYSGYHSNLFGNFGVNTLLAPANFLKGLEYIYVGDNVILAKGMILTAWDFVNKPQINIGDGTRFGENVHITCINSINIGKNVLTGRNVLITDNSHGNSAHMRQGIPPIDRPMCSKGGVTIGDNVWIGDNVSILPGVHVGDNSIIGANTVVSKSVPPNSVVVGSSMRVFNV